MVGPQWQEALQDSVMENGDLFEYTQVEDDYDVKHFDVFRDFVAQCEQLLDEYGKTNYLFSQLRNGPFTVEANGLSKDALMDECKDAIDGKLCALFEDDVNQWFIDLANHLQDFEWFAERMRKESNRGARIGK